MDYNPAWVSAVVGALMLGLAIGNALGVRRERERRALPIIRTEWTQGTGGRGAYITIINRMDEDLIVHEIATAGHFEVRHTKYNPLTGTVDIVRKEIVASPRRVDWLIKPGETRRETVYIIGSPASDRISMIVSSSSETLRRKRLVSRASSQL